MRGCRHVLDLGDSEWQVESVGVVSNVFKGDEVVSLAVPCYIVELLRIRPFLSAGIRNPQSADPLSSKYWNRVALRYVALDSSNSWPLSWRNTLLMSRSKSQVTTYTDWPYLQLFCGKIFQLSKHVRKLTHCTRDSRSDISTHTSTGGLARTLEIHPHLPHFRNPLPIMPMIPRMPNLNSRDLRLMSVRRERGIYLDV